MVTRDIEYSNSDHAISKLEFHFELTCKDTDGLIGEAVHVT